MKELIIIQKELKAPKGQYNEFANFYYRSCEDILEALKPLTTANGCAITVSDELVLVGERYYVRATARLTNSAGESVETTAYAREAENQKGMDQSQITGTASSYARKYALNGLFAIDDTKDADSNEGNPGNGKEQPKKEQPKPKEQPKKKPKELTQEDWDRMVENEAQGKKTRDGERIKDWWIRVYKPGTAQIRMFEEACLKKVGETVEKTGTMPAGARNIIDENNARKITEENTVDDTLLAAPQETDMPDFDNIFDNA